MKNRTDHMKPSELFTHPAVELISRWILGGTFVYASLCKIWEPMKFARSIAAYQLVPDTVARLMAVFLPWFELFCGLLLLIGLFTPGSIRLVTGMLVVFIGAILITLIRKIDVDCGCMTNCFTGEPEKSGNLADTLIRDLVYMLLTCSILFAKTRWLSLDQWLKARSGQT